MKITIPEPCDQRWEEMTPKGMNRHCQMCQKEIIDFSHYSDAALVKYIESHQGRICGRFMGDQLNREMVYQAPKKSVLSLISQKWLAFWLFASSPVHFLKAQVKTEVSPELKTTTDTNQFFISGRVIDERNNEPLPFVNIKLVELGYTTQSDENGDFKFIFQENSFVKFSIEAWRDDFIYNVKLNNISPNTKKNKIIIKEEIFIEEIPMVGVVVVQPKIDVFEPKTWYPRTNKRSKKIEVNLQY